MNREVEQFPIAMAGQNESRRGVLARVSGRIQKRFRRPGQEQLNRERKLRMEERRRERARIARELHDTLFQGFLAASMQLHYAVEQMPADSPSRPSLSRALGLVQRVINEGRSALQGLRSSGTGSVSLEEALSGLGDEFPRAVVPFRIFVKGQPKALNPAIQQQIYLIAREALINALCHSKATSIEAEVEYQPRRLRVIVRDNGCGIDPKVVRFGRKAHWGLQGMRERAGNIRAQLRVWSRPGAGTEVEISVPGQVLADACNLLPLEAPAIP